MTDSEFRELYRKQAGKEPHDAPTPLEAQLLRKAWSRETASPGCQEKWTSDNPAFGQCAATALVLQDVYDGDLMRVQVEGYGSHYYNLFRDQDGPLAFDATWCQFPEGTKREQGQQVERLYALHSPRAAEARTLERYMRLKERLFAALREM